MPILALFMSSKKECSTQESFFLLRKCSKKCGDLLIELDKNLREKKAVNSEVVTLTCSYRYDKIGAKINGYMEKYSVVFYITAYNDFIL